MREVRCDGGCKAPVLDNGYCDGCGRRAVLDRKPDQDKGGREVERRRRIGDASDAEIEADIRHVVNPNAERTARLELARIKVDRERLAREVADLRPRVPGYAAVTPHDPKESVEEKPKVPEGAIPFQAMYDADTAVIELVNRHPRASDADKTRAAVRAAYPAILKDLEERLLGLDWREINAAAETICPSRGYQPLACAQCVVQAALDSLEDDGG